VPYIFFPPPCGISNAVGGRAQQAILGAALVAVALVAAHAAAAAAPLWVVFSASPDGTAPTQLYRVQTTGTGLEQITKGSGPATDAAFSPDGKKVVFARLGVGIFVTNLDGTGVKRLTTGTRDTYPVWSPNGKRIAFVRVLKAEWRLFVMTASGAAEKVLPKSPPSGRPSWTADSKSIFIPAGAGIAKIDARTGNVQKRYNVTLDPSISQGATAAPNGKTFAFVGRRNPTGPPDCGESHCPAFALYLFDSTKGKTRKLVNDTGPAGWSPDSKSVVFVSRGDLTLSVVATGKSTKIDTATHVATGDAPPAWQPR
jgi:Tol biopolymer transport system component